jgi:hypothetical protein
MHCPQGKIIQFSYIPEYSSSVTQIIQIILFVHTLIIQVICWVSQFTDQWMALGANLVAIF